MKSQVNGPHDYKMTVVLAVLVLVGMCSSCSTLQQAEGTWRESYFKDPDSVWSTIQLVLLELDYEVTDENRYDGKLRAEGAAADDGAVVALAIDQVMHTEDQVNVYVKPSFASEGGQRDGAALKAAAEGFLKALNEKLRG